VHLRWLRDALVLPFAQSARRCFAFEALLRSAQRLGAIDGEELAAWRAAASPLATDDAGTWSGLLRPGTFEISSARLGDRAVLPRGNVAARREPPATLSPGTRSRLDELCRQSGLNLDAVALQRGFQMAHRARDLGKLAMSVHLSAGLEALARMGESLRLDRDALSWLVVADLGTAPATWPARITRRRARHGAESALRMPSLIDADTRLDAVVVPPGQPVYLGRGIVAGPVRRVGLHTCGDDALAGGVLLLERCEPGFDWVFAHAPAALVTAFGGPNAHVALRAHELGIPALLGVGLEALRRMADAQCLQIDFDAGWWRVPAASAWREA
jgi:phosphohistidine swiveling domain-containing protein